MARKFVLVTEDSENPDSLSHFIGDVRMNPNEPNWPRSGYVINGGWRATYILKPDTVEMRHGGETLRSIPRKAIRVIEIDAKDDLNRYYADVFITVRNLIKGNPKHHLIGSDKILLNKNNIGLVRIPEVSHLVSESDVPWIKANHRRRVSEELCGNS